MRSVRLTDFSNSGGPAKGMVSPPDVTWISARDGSRASGDLEDQAARDHRTRHELTITADFRATGDLITHWRRRYQRVPGARTVIEAHVREWYEQGVHRGRPRSPELELATSLSAACFDGSSKRRKNRRHRTVRLLPALAHDIRSTTSRSAGRPRISSACQSTTGYSALRFRASATC
jgi:hypothetical protein